MRTITTRDLIKQMPDTAVSMPDPAVNTEDHEASKSMPASLSFENFLENPQENLERENLRSKIATYTFLKFMVSQQSVGSDKHNKILKDMRLFLDSKPSKQPLAFTYTLHGTSK